MNCSLSSGQWNNKRLGDGLVPHFKRGKAVVAFLKSLMIIKIDKMSFSVIKIDGGNKKAIRNQLELLGITEGFIYPDIEHQSKALLKQINLWHCLQIVLSILFKIFFNLKIYSI